MSVTARARAFFRIHPLFGGVFLVQLLFLAALLAGSLRPLARVTVDPGTMTRTQEGTLVSQPLTLSSGGYRVAVQYREEGSSQEEDATATLSFASAADPSGVRGDAILLPERCTAVTGRIWVGTATTVGDLIATLTPAAGQTFTLEGLTLAEQPVWRVMSMVGWLLLFAAADALLCLLFLGDGPRAPRCGWGVPLLLAGGILLASLPFCADFLYTGHDLRFHCYRIWALAQSLAQGQFPVRIFTAGYNGYGVLTPQYYCDAFLYLPALLYNAFLPLQACYQVYVMLVNAATILLAYYSFARIGCHKLYGAAAAFAYTLCAYRLSNLLLRASVGEYTAMAFLPLVALGAWAIARQDRPTARDWLPLAVGMAGLVQSHLLTTELAALFLGVFWICNLTVMFRPARLAAALKAAAVALGLSAWFLLPCLDALQNEYIMISDVQSAPIQSTGTYLVQLLGLFGYAGGTSGWGTIGEMPLTLGLAGILVVALALWCCLHRARWRRDRQTALVWLGLRGSLALCLLAAWASSTVFPWDWLTAKLPRKLAEVFCKPQFSWRYLSIAAVLLGVTAVLALGLLEHCRPRRGRGMAALLVAATLLYTGVFYRDYIYNQTPLTLLSTESVADCPYESMGYEYLPAGTDLSIFRQAQASAEDPAVEAVWLGQGAAQCQNPTGGEAAVDLPVLAYRHYSAVDAATGETLPLTANDAHCLRVTLPAGYSGTVQLRYTPPLAWRAAELVSLLTLLGLAVAFIRARRLHRHTKPSVQEEELVYV